MNKAAWNIHTCWPRQRVKIMAHEDFRALQKIRGFMS
jgi:hypothetical protein